VADSSVPVHPCACSTCQTAPDSPAAAYHRQINVLLSRLTEPQRRWYVASLAADPSGPSAAQLTLITGLSLPTIRRGAAELATGLPAAPPKSRPGRGCAARTIYPRYARNWWARSRACHAPRSAGPAGGAPAHPDRPAGDRQDAARPATRHWSAPTLPRRRFPGAACSEARRRRDPGRGRLRAGGAGDDGRAPYFGWLMPCSGHPSR
jgi:hypothetical protein